ncbi:MAG: flavin reductase family protein [Thermoguttaceae bacterium]|nr:flavin reductase family protein [Thermoguttaceae bacterium]
MKKKINVNDYAGRITEALPKGILLCTNGEKFNAMTIGWGGIGTNWSIPVFTVYVRESRYTKSLLDRTGEFTISVPLGAPNPKINAVCGSKSGRDTDKVSEAGLTLEPPTTINTPGIREYPLTLECKVLYVQPQELDRLPKEIVERFYPQNVPGTFPMANRDPHTTYIGQIVDAYIIE